MTPHSPDPQFMPRPEFIREQKSTPNSFALLTISGPNCIRLYSFNAEVIATLRRFLEQRVVIQTIREDPSNRLYEFALEGKPWSSPKNLATERFLVDLLAVLYRSGYNYLSTIDYGRESDDKVAITFSCPTSPPASRSQSPLPSSKGSSFDRQQRSYKVPFALSFPSSTILRVVNPPLHSTPAILQAVRSSWPRGVESEKKIGDNCFEFKLKGYRWFQEDTFATDSLQHILSLLSSLDAHSFTLQTSISLSNRSRIKDLWIFTGPASFSSQDDALFPNCSSPSLFNSSQPLTRAGSSKHTRLNTEPILPHETIVTSPTRATHQRAVTEDHPALDNGLSPPPTPSSVGSNVLRKAAPRAQVPVSVHEGEQPDEMEYHRAVLPSIVSEGSPNMTGVGATPDVFYHTSPFRANDSEPPLESSNIHASPSTTPPFSPAHAPSPPSETPISTPGSEQRPDGRSLSGPLLSPEAFRDSAFSSSTEMSKDIPIKWTGDALEHRPNYTDRQSMGPLLPGGWQPTPVEEDRNIVAQDTDDLDLRQNVRVASPEITDPTQQEIRQSEAALMGVIPPPTPPATDNAPTKSREESAGSGQGWVLVNVEAKESSPASPSGPPPVSNGKQPSSDQATMSPAAKAIVIIDAKDSKEKKESLGSSRVRRFFSLSRKDSPKLAERLEGGARTRSRSGFGQRLKRIGTPEATRNEDNRRSFD